MVFVAAMNGLGLPGVRLEACPATTCGIAGTHMRVTVDGAEEHEPDAPGHDHGQGHVHGHDHAHGQEHPHPHAHDHDHGACTPSSPRDARPHCRSHR